MAIYEIKAEGEGFRVWRNGRAEGPLHATAQAARDYCDDERDDDYRRGRVSAGDLAYGRVERFNADD